MLCFDGLSLPFLVFFQQGLYSGMDGWMDINVFLGDVE